MNRSLDAITSIIVHHSASPLSTSLEDIEQWHLARGWDGVGYHAVIEASGKLRYGRPIERVGAHAMGHNRESIGICLVGNNTQPANRWLPAQLHTLEDYVLGVRYVLEQPLQILRHCEVRKTECPGLTEDEWAVIHHRLEAYT